MIHTIGNEKFTLRADSKGAEMCGFAADGYEYIWQGNDVWGGHSPLLFPVVGKLRDDAYELNGVRYTMAKHGFAKNSEFELEQNTGDEMTFLLTDSEATRAGYPYAFELRVCFRLTEKGFVIEHRVKNTNASEMYFSIGAHPGFRCEMGDVLVMDEAETAGAFQFNADFLRDPNLLPVFDNSREIVITPELFAKDALVFDGLKSRGMTLRRANGKHVHVDFGGAPCLGLWAKPGQKYVCIEPWYGIDDIAGADPDFTRKERICRIGAGDEFVFPVTVTLL